MHSSSRCSNCVEELTVGETGYSHQWKAEEAATKKKLEEMEAAEMLADMPMADPTPAPIVAAQVAVNVQAVVKPEVDVSVALPIVI